MQVSELEGPLLDYWVAKTLGHVPRLVNNSYCEIIDWNRPDTKVNGCRFEPTTDWNHGSPLLKRFSIYTTMIVEGRHAASVAGSHYMFYGRTRLIAGMRAVVFSKYGIGVPDEVR